MENPLQDKVNCDRPNTQLLHLSPSPTVGFPVNVLTLNCFKSCITHTPAMNKQQVRLICSSLASNCLSGTFITTSTSVTYLSSAAACVRACVAGWLTGVRFQAGYKARLGRINNNNSLQPVFCFSSGASTPWHHHHHLWLPLGTSLPCQPPIHPLQCQQWHENRIKTACFCRMPSWSGNTRGKL